MDVRAVDEWRRQGDEQAAQEEQDGRQLSGRLRRAEVAQAVRGQGQ
jgi:hypothetical protein